MYWIVQEWSLRTGGLCVEVVCRTGSTVYMSLTGLVQPEVQHVLMVCLYRLWPSVDIVDTYVALSVVAQC